MNRNPFGRLTLRGKLTLAAMAPLVPVLLLVAVAAYALINTWIVDEAQRRVTRQLHAAREVLRQEESHLHEVLRLTAQAPGLAAAIAAGDRPRLSGELVALLQREGFDLLGVVDPQGTVLCRGNNPADPGGDPAPASLRQGLSRHGEPCGPLLFTAAELQREGAALAGRAEVRLNQRADAARPPVETRGLFLVCTVPLRDSSGRLFGYLYGGLLLNNNLALVDRIQEIIYGGETHEGIESGSATIFLHDLRVATTVRLADRERALGTLISPQVAEAVLGKRQHWLDRALVVDQWYLTAYEPLIDNNDQVVGALYVGLLERPYQQLKRRAALLLCGLLVLGGGIGLVMARSGAEHLSQPIRQLEVTARRIADGERDIILPVTSGDEIGQLTETFNRMTRSVVTQEEELLRFNRELESKIAERTTLLEEKSLSLLQAREELARAERLAAIGSLAAGVAHEINNPAAIIRGNIELLRRELPAGCGSEEIAEVLHQIERISLITHGLLSFAREEKLTVRPVQLNPLLEEILAQVGHQVPLSNIALHTELAQGLPDLIIDRERLRQVVTNLVLNALQAMGGQGVLRLASRRDANWVEIVVSDSGPGIDAATQEKLFHPFFTTKPDGSGLGLAIAYGIVRTMGGTINVESAAGEGALFRVRLPLGTGSVAGGQDKEAD